MIKELKVVLVFSLLLVFAQTQAVDGELDTSFNPNADDTVSTITVQGDGKILLGGNFTSIGGVERSNLVRLTTKGLVDESFANVELNGSVLAILVQADGGILLSGSFTLVNQVERNRIARLDADGNLDTEFDPDVTGVGAGGSVGTLALQTDGRILIGGSFTAVGSGDSLVARSNLARLESSGALDTSFDPSPDRVINSIVVRDDDRILVGGDFHNIDSTEHANVALLNVDGSLNPAVADPMIRFLADFNVGFVRLLATQASGEIVVVGIFDRVGGVASSGVARLNANGTLDPNFVIPNLGATSNVIRAVTIQPNGDVLVGGSFDQVTIPASVTLEGVSVPERMVSTGSLVRLNAADGSLDESFAPNVRTDVSDIKVQAIDEDILIGGGFNFVGGVRRNHIARVKNGPVAVIDFVSDSVNEQQEGDIGERLYTFDLVRTVTTAGYSTVHYQVSGGATNPADANDFAPQVFSETGSVTFANGVAEQTISVAVLGDRREERDESFTITLLDPHNAALGVAISVQGSILEDDQMYCTPIKPSANETVHMICF